MNLFDLPERDLFNIKEVGLCIRDLALSRIPNRRISASDQCIYSTEDFHILLISNSVVLKKPQVVGENKWSSRFSFAVNYDDMNDDRPYSTRYNADRERYVIRHSYTDSILKVTDRNVYFTTVKGDEEYIDTIQEFINYSDMEPEIFQRSLVETPDIMNVIMLNYLFRRDIPYMHTEPDITLHGYLTELELMLKAFPHLEEIRKLC